MLCYLPMYNDIDENRQIIEFFKIIYRGIRKHGLRRIVKSLDSIEIEQNNLYFNEIVDYIIEIVTIEFKCKKEDLFNFDKRGNITVARKISVILIKTHLDISDEQLGKYFNRVRQVVYNTLKEFKNLDRESKLDDEFFELHDKLNIEVCNYIEKLKLENNGNEKTKTTK